MEEVLFEPDKPVEMGERDFKGSDSVKLEAMVEVSDTLTDSLVGIPVPVTDALTTPEVVLLVSASVADMKSEKSTVLRSRALDTEVEMNTVEKVATTDEGRVKNDDAMCEPFKAVEEETDNMLEGRNVVVVNGPEDEERLLVGSSVDVELASGKLWLGKTDIPEVEVRRDELRDVSEARLPEVGLLKATPEDETRIDELRPNASDVGMSREELGVSKMLEPPVALASRELTKAATSTVDDDDKLLRTEARLLLGISLARKD
jgi:hypothetical protein